VFFRQQDDLDNDLQKELAQRLGQLSGKPETSKLHIHPVSNSGRRLGGKDDEISVISSEQAKELYKNRFLNFNKKQSAKEGWHSDITFEPIPSDYAILRLTELPSTGGGAYFHCCLFLENYLRSLQILFGPQVTSFTIAFLPHTRNFSRSSQQHTLNLDSRLPPKRMALSYTRNHEELPKTLAQSSKQNIPSSVRTLSQAGNLSLPLVIMSRLLMD
jgi:hypothetical protein